MIFKSKDFNLINGLEIFFLSMMIFFLTLKPAFRSDDWAIPNLPNYLYILQGGSQYISSFFSIACFILILLFIKSKKIYFSITCFLFSFVLILYACRSFLIGSQDYKNVISIFLILINYIYFSTFLAEKRIFIPYFSIQIAVILWILCNLILFFTGYGYAVLDTSTRFFGSSPHPNFTGAYAALGLSLFLTIYVKKNNVHNKLLLMVIILCSLFLVFISGSRSALLASIISCFIILPNFYKILPLILGGLFYFIFLVVYTDNPIYLAVERMRNAPLDNRNEVWNSLFNDFFRNPLLGSGDFSGVSGSGYLTALGGTGLIGISLFALAMILGLYISFRNILLAKYFGRNNQEYCIIFIVICLISFFEGYIFDKFGFFQILLLLSTAMLGPFAFKKLIFK